MLAHLLALYLIDGGSCQVPQCTPALFPQEGTLSLLRSLWLCMSNALCFTVICYPQDKLHAYLTVTHKLIWGIGGYLSRSYPQVLMGNLRHSTASWLPSPFRPVFHPDLAPAWGPMACEN